MPHPALREHEVKRHVAFIGRDECGKRTVRTFANPGVLRIVCDASRECLDRHSADSAVVRTGLLKESE
jgi:xanthine/CO dehydrogenase XdhC/CoxF family maturation factor